MAMLPITASVPRPFSITKPDTHEVLLQAAVVDLGAKTSEGQIIQAVTIPWLLIFQELDRDPRFLFEFAQYPRKFEEFIAGAYEEDGWQVVLTPQSGDLGRDVIARKPDVMAIRVLDQCKAFSPGHVVTAHDVRAMYGVLSKDQNVSKGVITTTSKFAPRVQEQFKDVIPYRLDLRDGPALREWLRQVAKKTEE